MLQVVDDIDDLLMAGRQRCENVLQELGSILVGVSGIAATGAALALGANPSVIAATAVSAAFIALLQARSPS